MITNAANGHVPHLRRCDLWHCTVAVPAAAIPRHVDSTNHSALVLNAHALSALKLSFNHHLISRNDNRIGHACIHMCGRAIGSITQRSAGIYVARSVALHDAIWACVHTCAYNTFISRCVYLFVPIVLRSVVVPYGCPGRSRRRRRPHNNIINIDQISIKQLGCHCARSSAIAEYVCVCVCTSASICVWSLLLRVAARSRIAYNYPRSQHNSMVVWTNTHSR